MNIGRYEILKVLGRGGMGIVYHALDPRFNREVAIKVLPSEVLIDSTFRTRFEREAQTIASLGHSAIVPVHDYGEFENEPYLVMAYMGGGSLADRIREYGQLEAADVIPILNRVASALDTAHARGIIHRDIKPANILFSSLGECFLSDFGIVKLTEGSTHLTGGGIVGTPHYMAPDLLEEGGLTKLVDVYALGVTLYETLTAKRPYNADTPMGIIFAHGARAVPDIRVLRPDLPAAVSEVVRTALAKEPEQRYQSAGELAQAYADALVARPEDPSTVPFVEETERYHTPEVLADSASNQLIDAPTGNMSVQAAQRRPPGRRQRKLPTLVVIGVGAALLGILLIGAVLLVASLARPNPITTGDTSITELPVQNPTSTQAAATALDSEDSGTDNVSGCEETIHVVQAGETFFQIADMYGLTPEEITIYNQALDSNFGEQPPLVGQEIIIPDCGEGSLETLPQEELLAIAGVSTNSEWEPYIQEFDGVEMALVPSGCFMMGRNDTFTHQQPAHEVCFNVPYWLDVFEVTNEQFARFDGRAREPSYNSGANNPRENLAWFESEAFCESRNTRLSTEAEWEYAARGPDGLYYPWGDTFIGDNLVFQENAAGQPAPVGSRDGGASWVGAYDLSGNVREWVADWYNSGYYAVSPGINPQGPDSGTARMQRGGSYSVTARNASNLSSTYRMWTDPSTASRTTGFRCARSY